MALAGKDDFDGKRHARAQDILVVGHDGAGADGARDRIDAAVDVFYAPGKATFGVARRYGLDGATSRDPRGVLFRHIELDQQFVALVERDDRRFRADAVADLDLGQADNAVERGCDFEVAQRLARLQQFQLGAFMRDLGIDHAGGGIDLARFQQLGALEQSLGLGDALGRDLDGEFGLLGIEFEDEIAAFQLIAGAGPKAMITPSLLAWIMIDRRARAVPTAEMTTSLRASAMVVTITGTARLPRRFACFAACGLARPAMAAEI